MIQPKVLSGNFPESAVVIGAGIGGLSVAALLAKHGCKVTLLDRCNDAVGGLSKTIEENGFKFTFGPKYLWNFSEGEIGDKFLKALDLSEKVTMGHLDQGGFDRIYEESLNQPFLVPENLEEYKRRLYDAFPHDKSGIKKFFKQAETKYTFLRFAEQNELQFETWGKSFRTLLAKFWTQPFTLLGFFYGIRKTFSEACDECHLSEPLRRVLFANGLIYAEPADTISFYAYVGASFNYMRGAFFPADGMINFIDELKRVIEDNSGKIVLGSKVSEIETNGDNRITRAIDSEGNSYQADLFISNIDPAALHSLLKQNPDSYCPKPLPNYKYSHSLTSIFIGIDDADLIKPTFGNWNIWHCEEGMLSGNLYDRPADSPMPHVYLSSPSFMGGGIVRDAPLGGATLTAFAPASYSEFEEALDVSRKAHDRLLKAQVQNIIDVIDSKYTKGIKGRISCVRAFSPIDVKEQFSAAFGNVYGKSFSVNDVTTKLPWNHELANLYCVGQFTTFAGVVNAILSSCKVFEEVSGISIRNNF